MALAWVAQLNEQRTVTFFLYSLLHFSIKTFVESLGGFAFVQYIHYTLSGCLENLKQ